jgi:opacity protein-like surface antigen
MRKLGIVVTAIACLMVAAVAFAADAPAAGGALTFGVNGGVAIPTGDFGDGAKMGFTGGVFGEYGINEQFAIGVGADYVKVSAKDDVIKAEEDAYTEFAGEAITAKMDMSIIPILAYAKWMPPMKGQVAPYIMAGGGFYMAKSKVEFTPDPDSRNGDSSDNKAGFFGGVGVDFKATPQVKIGVFGKYHNILTEGTSTAYMTAGVNVGFGLAK